MTILVQQRGDHDCGIAACAMLTGMNYEAVAARFVAWHERYKELPQGTDETDYRKFFADIGWTVFGPFGGYRNEFSFDVIRQMLVGRRALVSVRSLNNDAGYHMVYYDGERVWDPQDGRHDRTAFRMLWSLPLRAAWLFDERQSVSPPTL